ncbi:MAG: DNA recombination protein RmuC, partial [Chitinophagaceae bacterium]|nr:DNA recombination protein RmuC [Chitinophagaceae bacterium]
ISLVLLVVCALLLLAIFFKKADSNTAALQSKIQELEKGLQKIEVALKEDFRVNRDESAKMARENRTELTDSLSRTGKEQSEKLEALIVKIEDKNRELRADIEKSFKVFAEGFDRNVKSFNDLQREKFTQLDDRQAKLMESTENKLEQMRATVDEKLQKTLNERLGQSFEMVGKQLESVQKGLGEMQTLATDVGGLKKVLSNVKLRGNVGEVQLAMILEQTLAPTQYDVNVRTKAGSSDPVEFAIKLPGRSEDESSVVYLPIDAKFPKDVYEQLLNAYEHASTDEIEVATKALESTIKKMAKDIRDKYIDPPNTTDFAILFLPFESIYAEVIRRSGLVDQLRDEFKITVAGPTTLVAILNSLQMGFRTLALQKRSSEVWKVLGSVKKEFENFGGMLEKAQKNIQTGMSQLDEVVGTRTRAIQRQLRGVDSLPAADSDNNILPDIIEEKGD